MIDKILSAATGGLAETIMGAVKDYFPPDMKEDDKQKFALAFKNVELQKQTQVDKAANEAEKNINERIAAHEGTAKDLMSLPVVGRLLIFARGCQRPVWGFATMYIDFMWFSNAWVLNERQESAVWVINLLVLGFLFGERAIKNVMPLVAQYFGKK